MFRRIPYNNQVGRELSKLIRIPIDHYKDVRTLLKLSHFGPALGSFDYRGRTLNSAYIVQNILDTGIIIPSQDEVSKQFNLKLD